MRYRFEDAELDFFRKTVRKYVTEKLEPHYEAWEEAGIIPKEIWRDIGEMGYLCPQVDENYGGLGLDDRYNIVIMEELERIGCSMNGFGLHSAIVMPYIEAFGNEAQKKRYLPGCVDGTIITAIGMTEPGTGSDLANIQTIAKKDGDDYSYRDLAVLPIYAGTNEIMKNIIAKHIGL